MSYIDIPQPKPTPTPPPTPPYFPVAASISSAFGGGPFSQGDGSGFTTTAPFTANDYAIGRGLDLATAQAVLDQAVAQGLVRQV